MLSSVIYINNDYYSIKNINIISKNFLDNSIDIIILTKANSWVKRLIIIGIT